MSRQRRADEGIVYNPGEINTPYEGLRELANVIVATAADDYVTYLLKPDYQLEADTLEQAAKEAVAVEMVIKKVKGDKNYFPAVQSLFEEVAERSLKTKYIGKHTTKKVRWTISRVKAAKNLEDLKLLVRYYVKTWKDRMYVMRDRNANRKALGRECVEFFHSKLFVLCTSGTIDPERLMEQCHKEADKIRRARQ